MYVKRDAYTYKTDSLVDALARVLTDIKRDIRMYTYMSKETYIYVKRDANTRPKNSLVTCTGEGSGGCWKRHMYIYVKRDTCTCQKRHMYMSKETYVHTKKTLLSHARARNLNDVKKDIYIHTYVKRDVFRARNLNDVKTDIYIHTCAERDVCIFQKRRFDRDTPMHTHTVP